MTKPPQKPQHGESAKRLRERDPLLAAQWAGWIADNKAELVRFVADALQGKPCVS